MRAPLTSPTRPLQDLGADAARAIELIQRNLAAAINTVPDTIDATALLVNGWVNWGPPYQNLSYWRTADGVVYVQGLVKSGVINQPIMTLPTGFRPPFQLIFPAVSNGVFGLFEIFADGRIVPNFGNNTYFSVECSFISP